MLIYSPIPANSGERGYCPPGEGLCAQIINETGFLFCSIDCYRDPQLVELAVIGLGAGMFTSLVILIFLEYAKQYGWCDAPIEHSHNNP